MLEFLRPQERFGRFFDRGSILFEFDALREPERTTFPKIGEWVRERVPMVEIPTPSMLWRGKLWPDLYIANQLEAVPNNWRWKPKSYAEYPLIPKFQWGDALELDVVSKYLNGELFHAAFIEPMCLKITGLPSAQISAKHHRAIWLPLYWPQTLRSRQSIPTKFYYPAAGYAGSVLSHTGAGENVREPAARPAREFSAAELSIAYVTAVPRSRFSVLFVVDDSPIYRITDQDACAGLDPEFHRYVVEYRGECNVVQELERLGLTYHARHIAFDCVRLSLPTLSNVAEGWKPRPTINDQLWQAMGHD